MISYNHPRTKKYPDDDPLAVLYDVDILVPPPLPYVPCITYYDDINALSIKTSMVSPDSTKSFRIQKQTGRLQSYGLYDYYRRLPCPGLQRSGRATPCLPALKVIVQTEAIDVRVLVAALPGVKGVIVDKRLEVACPDLLAEIVPGLQVDGSEILPRFDIGPKGRGQKEGVKRKGSSLLLTLAR